MAMTDAFWNNYWRMYLAERQKKKEILEKWLNLNRDIARQKQEGIIRALQLLMQQQAERELAKWRQQKVKMELMDLMRKEKAEQRRLMTAGGRPKQADPYKLLREIDTIKMMSPELSPFLNEIHQTYIESGDASRIIDRLNKLEIQAEPIYSGFGRWRRVAGYKWHIKDPISGKEYTVDDFVYSKLLDLISTLQLMQQSQTPYGGRVYQYESVPTGTQPAPTQVPQGQWQPTQMKIKVNLNDLDKMLPR